MRREAALVVVDAQPTFMPGGGLAVADGHLVVPEIKRLMQSFYPQRRYATRDLHPLGHVSLASSYLEAEPFSVVSVEDIDKGSVPLSTQAQFSSSQLHSYLKVVRNQVRWPDHAVDGTAESQLHPELPAELFAYVQKKGQDPACDSYSGYFDNLRRPTGLGSILKGQENSWAVYVGLALDYCVGDTAIDGLQYGIKPHIILSATKAVNINGSLERMMARLEDAGAVIHENVDSFLLSAQRFHL